MTRPNDCAQLEYLVHQGYHLHACCPVEHHDIDVANHVKRPCGEHASDKVPYDLDKRRHLTAWGSAAGLTKEELGRIWKLKPQPGIGMALGKGIMRLDIDSERGETHIKTNNLTVPDSWKFISSPGHRGILYKILGTRRRWRGTRRAR